MLVTHKGTISNVVEKYKMTEAESFEFVRQYEKELNLSKEQFDRWSTKKCLAVYEIKNIEKIESFKYNRENNMDDWIITDNINNLK